MVTDERFWSSVSKRADGCWIWTGAIGSGGYGSVRREGRIWKTHGWAWFLEHGSVPAWSNHFDACLCHRCDNPACVNPDHLFVGTPSDNARDRNAKGRAATRKGRSNGRAILTPPQVLEARRLRASGGWTWPDLALRFGVSRSAIRLAVVGRNWSHLEEAEL
jgi:hypothetical protein